MLHGRRDDHLVITRQPAHHVVRVRDRGFVHPEEAAPVERSDDYRHGERSSGTIHRAQRKREVTRHE